MPVVASIIPLTSASASLPYYTEDSRYARGAHRRASRWAGTGAAELGLTGSVAPATFAALLEGSLPGSGIRFGRSRAGMPERRPGVDVTLSPRKSVSVELFGARNRAVRQAHDEAVVETAEYIEQQWFRIRRYNKATRRRETIPAKGMVAALFRHVTSRSLDPQLHTHVLVINCALDEEGGWCDLALNEILRRPHLIGAVYDNALAVRLRRIGLALKPSRIGHMPGYEIADYGQELLAAFSGRRKEILQYIAQRDLAYSAGAARVATLATRRAKAEPTVTELEAMWRDRYVQLRSGRRRVRIPPVGGADEAEAPSVLEIVARVAAEEEERVSAFPAERLLSMALARCRGRHTRVEVEEAIATMVRHRHLVAGERRGVGATFVTEDCRRARKEVIRVARAEEGGGHPLVEPAAIPVEAGAGLSDAERAAVRVCLLADRRTVGVQVYAGIGKTRVVRELVGSCQDRTVMAVAPTAAAADALGRNAAIPSRTLRSFLRRYRDLAFGIDEHLPASERGRLVGALLVVDGAAAMSTRQMRDLLRVADALGLARVVLIADRKDLRSREAEQVFHVLRAAGMPVALMDRQGRVARGGLRRALLDALGDLGIPAEADVLEVPWDAIAEVSARAWLSLPDESRATTAIVAQSDATAGRINDVVQEGLREEGVLNGPTFVVEVLVDRGLSAAQKREADSYAPGDVLVFSANRPTYRIRAGDTCDVMAVETDGDRAKLRLVHQGGTPRHLALGSSILYDYDVCRPVTVTLQAGDLVRWTRTDALRDLVAGQLATIITVGPRRITIEAETGRRLRLERDDRHLRHLRLAYCSTGCESFGGPQRRVLGVIDSSLARPAEQRDFRDGVRLAGEGSVILTDNAALLRLDPAGDPTPLRVVAETGTGADLRQPIEGLLPAGAIGSKALPDTSWTEHLARQEAHRVGVLEEEYRTLTRGWRRLQHAAERANRHVSRYPQHEYVGERLDRLAGQQALPDGLRTRVVGAVALHVAETLTRDTIGASAARIETAMRRRAGLASAVSLGAADPDVTTSPDYAHWRRELEAATVAAELGLRKPIAWPRATPSARRRLDAAIAWALRKLEDDDERIAQRMVARRAARWQRDWLTLLEGEQQGRESDPHHVERLIERLSDLRGDRALSFETSRSMLDMYETRESLVEYRVVAQDRDRMITEAGQQSQSVCRHRSFGDVLARAERLVDRRGLPAPQRVDLSDWVERSREESVLADRCDAARAAIGAALAQLHATDGSGLDALYGEVAAARAGGAMHSDAMRRVPHEARLLADSVDEAGETLSARERHTQWRAGWAEFARDCKANRLDPDGAPGYRSHARAADRLVADPYLPRATRAEIVAWRESSYARRDANAWSAARRKDIEDTLRQFAEQDLDGLDLVVRQLTEGRDAAQEGPPEQVGRFERARLIDAVDTADAQIATSTEFARWRADYAAHVSRQRGDPFGSPECRPHVRRARDLLKATTLAPAQRGALEDFLVAHAEALAAAIATAVDYVTSATTEPVGDTYDRLDELCAEAEVASDDPLPDETARVLRERLAQGRATGSAEAAFARWWTRWTEYESLVRAQQRDPYAGAIATRLAAHAARFDSALLAPQHRARATQVVSSVFEAWHPEWQTFVAKCAREDEPPFAAEGVDVHLEATRDLLAAAAHLGPGPRQHLQDVLSQHKTFKAAQEYYDDIRERWEMVEDQAQSDGVAPFDLAEADSLLIEMRSIVGASEYFTAVQRRGLQETLGAAVRHRRQSLGSDYQPPY
ncbi:MAG: relaxase domain-containing protein [Gammaproteobacteria bacterium]|nr:relaxase domain-containing protein [Gammaproteobacteria bacterium]